MRSAVRSHVKMANVSRIVPGTCVRGWRSYNAETKSKPACIRRHGAKEKSGIFTINTRLTPAHEQVRLNKLTEKKVGVIHHFEIFSKKERFFLSQYIQNQACYLVNILTLNYQEILIMSSWDSWIRFQKEFGMFMFQNQNGRATFRKRCPAPFAGPVLLDERKTFLWIIMFFSKTAFQEITRVESWATRVGRFKAWVQCMW